MNIKEGEKLLLEIKKIMDELNIVFFLRHGTCLGAVRDGQLIEWDDDIDIYYLRSLYSKSNQWVYLILKAKQQYEMKIQIPQHQIHLI